MLVCVISAAIAGSLGVDAGIGITVSGINESGTNNAVFGAAGPTGKLQLHLDDFFVEGDADLAIGVAGAFATGNEILFAGPAEAFGFGSSASASIVGGYRFGAGHTIFSIGAGPWVGLVPYSCGDCFSDMISIGVVARGGIAFAVGTGGVFAVDAELAAGAAELFYYTSPPVTVRPALRLSMAWTFGDP